MNFSNLAKQLHTDIDSVLKSNNITIPFTNDQDVSLLHDTSVEKFIKPICTWFTLDV
jgi:small-conductance mechanosensitive channel